MKPAIRLMSFLVLTTFLIEQLSFAAELKPQAVNVFETKKLELDFKFPDSIATIEDSWKARKTGGACLPDRQGSRIADSGQDAPSKSTIHQPPSNTLVYLIQDAHTNESGQINLAKTLDIILKHYQTPPIPNPPPIPAFHIFVEAGVGNDSLSFLRTHAPLEKRKQVATEYLKKGILHGEEYLDLTSDHPFTIWGVEDMTLYQQAIESYRQVVKHREKFQSYLSKIQITIHTLKPRIFNSSLLSFDEKHTQFLKEQLPLTDYFQVLTQEAEKRTMEGESTSLSLSNFPHLQSLNNLKEKESKIDFKKASEDQQKAIQSLSSEDQQELFEYGKKEAPFKLGNNDRKEDKAFYVLLEEKLTLLSSSKSLPAGRQVLSGNDRGHRNNELTYPNLFKYFNYLKQVKSLNPKKILEEQQQLENQLFSLLAKTKDEQLLLHCQKNLRLLQKLFDLKLNPQEYKEYKQDSQSFTIHHLTGFLNKKIMDLQNFYERVAFLEEGYNTIIKHSETFYELTKDRDEKFIENMLDKMDDGQLTHPSVTPAIPNPPSHRVAVLITGGFHTPNLKALLKQRNISFVSITPQVYQETNQKRYESLLLNQKINQNLLTSTSGVPVQHMARLVAIRATEKHLLNISSAMISQGTPNQTLSKNPVLVGQGARLSEVPKKTFSSPFGQKQIAWLLVAGQLLVNGMVVSKPFKIVTLGVTAFIAACTPKPKDGLDELSPDPEYPALPERLDTNLAMTQLLKQLNRNTSLIPTSYGLPNDDPLFGSTNSGVQASVIQALLATNRISDAERLANGLLAVLDKNRLIAVNTFTSSAFEWLINNGYLTKIDESTAHINTITDTDDLKNNLIKVYGPNEAEKIFSILQDVKYWAWQDAYITTTGEAVEASPRSTKTNLAIGRMFLNLSNATRKTEYRQAAERISKWLEPLFKDHGSYGFLKAGDNVSTAFVVDNQSAMVFYYKLSRPTRVSQIETWLNTKMFSEKDKRYYVGLSEAEPETIDLDPTSAIEAQFYGILVASSAGKDPRKFAGGIDWLLENLTTIKAYDTANYGRLTLIGVPEKLGLQRSISTKYTAGLAAALRSMNRSEATILDETVIALQLRNMSLLPATPLAVHGSSLLPLYSAEATAAAVLAADFFGRNYTKPIPSGTPMVPSIEVLPTSNNVGFLLTQYEYALNIQVTAVSSSGETVTIGSPLVYATMDEFDRSSFIAVLAMSRIQSSGTAEEILETVQAFIKNNVSNFQIEIAGARLSEANQPLVTSAAPPPLFSRLHTLPSGIITRPNLAAQLGIQALKEDKEQLKAFEFFFLNLFFPINNFELSIAVDPNSSSVPIFTAQRDPQNKALKIFMVFYDQFGGRTDELIHTIEEADEKLQSLRKLKPGDPSYSEINGLKAAMRLTDKVFSDILGKDFDEKFEGVVQIDFAEVRNTLKKQNASPEETAAFLSGLLHALKQHNGNFSFVNLKEGLSEFDNHKIGDDLSKLAWEIIFYHQEKGKGMIYDNVIKKLPPDIPVTELIFFNGEAATLTANNTAIYALGSEEGSIPNYYIIISLAHLAADFFTKQLNKGLLPKKGQQGYEDLLKALSTHKFFEALNRFSSGDLSAEQVYEVMLGSPDLKITLIEQSAIRPLMRYLSNRLHLAKLMVQALIAA